MRFVLGLVTLAAALPVAGCQGQSEEQIRGELRAQLLQRCNRDIAPSTNALPGFDSAGYCGCVTGKAVGERSLAELKILFEDRARMTAEGRAAATECLAGQSEAVRQAAVVAPVPAPEPEPEEETPPAKAERPEPRRRAPAPTRPVASVERPQPVPSVRVAPEPEPAVEDVEEEPSDRG